MLSASVCLVRGYKGECPVVVTQCLYGYKTHTRRSIAWSSFFLRGVGVGVGRCRVVFQILTLFQAKEYYFFHKVQNINHKGLQRTATNIPIAKNVGAPKRGKAAVYGYNPALF